MTIRAISGLVIAISLFAAGTAVAGDYSDSVGQSFKFREAGFYQVTSSDRGIELGLDPVSAAEQIRLFGRKIGGFKTYEVAVTNNSRYRAQINALILVDKFSGADIQRAELSQVIRKNKPGGRGNKDHWRLAILRDNLLGKAFANTIVEPGQTAQGVIFVPKDAIGEGGGTLMVRIQNLKRLAYLEIEVSFGEVLVASSD